MSANVPAHWAVETKALIDRLVARLREEMLDNAQSAFYASYRRPMPDAEVPWITGGMSDAEDLANRLGLAWNRQHPALDVWNAIEPMIERELAALQARP